MSGTARGALWMVLAICIFLLADSLIFRTGLYTVFLEPDSSAGTLESQLYWLRHTPPSKLPEVLVVGDSRIAEGFSSRIADSSVNQRLDFVNFGMPGTTPRVWYYALRDADPGRRRFAAIAIALDKYSEADWFGLSEDRVSDQNFLVMRLGFGDCADFASSIQTMTLRHRSLLGCLFRGVILRDDVQAFLGHPKARITRALDWRRNGVTYLDDYTGKPESLRGLTVDWSNRTIHFPSGVAPAIRDQIRQFVLPEDVPDRDALARYRRRWLGGILDMYKESPTRIIFFRLPRGPVVNPHARPETERSLRFINAAAPEPRITILPPRTFNNLEQPELFADGLHLNHDGRPIFSEQLASQLDTVLNGPRTTASVAATGGVH